MQSAVRVRFVVFVVRYGHVGRVRSWKSNGENTLVHGKIHGTAGVRKFRYDEGDGQGATTDNDKTERSVKCDEVRKMSVGRSARAYGRGGGVQIGESEKRFLYARKAFHGAYPETGGLFPNRTIKC